MNKELSILLPTMRAAGDIILELQENGFSVSRKINNDLLTQADVTVNELLKERLLNEFPNDGWLSEESHDDKTRLQCQRIWLVDPIDGTIEFATGVPEYAISVALIENGNPIVAAIFNPATDELFHAATNQGAWLGEQRLHCSHPCQKGLVLLASRTEYKRGKWDKFKELHDVKAVGSIAYKLALVAAGKADATFSLGPKNEWDIAAGVLLVQEAGGVATNQRKQPFVFNQQNTLVDGIVATSLDTNARVFEMINHCLIT